MNIVSNQTPNYNIYNRNNNSRPAFKGVLGDKLVKELAEKGGEFKTEQMMQEVKGMMGPNKAKVNDVVESFVGKIKELVEINPKKSQELRELEAKQRALPDTYQVNYQAEQEVRNEFAAQTQEMNKRVEATQKRLQAAQAEAKIFEPMKEVKSIEEIGVMMPEEAMKLIDETHAHKNEAADSMFNYLMNNGDGVGVFEQMTRYRGLNKAYCQDCLYLIPEVAAHWKGKHAPVSDPVLSGLELVRMAMKGNKQGSYLESNYTRRQVTDRAANLFKPMIQDGTSRVSEQEFDRSMNNILDEAVEYHRNYPKGLAKIKENNANCTFVDHPDGYDINMSYLEALEPNGNLRNSYTYEQIASIGRHNY